MSEANHRYAFSHFRTAEQILAHYDGAEPFPFFIKAFFRDNRKFGSRDRREISRSCYAFFRLGNALPDLPIRERILAGHFLCHAGADPLLEAVRPEWLPAMELPLPGRERFLQEQHPAFSLTSVFPCLSSLSEGIDEDAFIRSHFSQPRLFIRLRPGSEEKTVAQLVAAGIPFVRSGISTVSLPNGTDLDILGRPDEAYVVQDLSSQRTAGFLPPLDSLPGQPLVWDACAGSGGKSLMAHDLLPGCRLDVSDGRESILRNLSVRFSSAGITDHRVFTYDITHTNKRKNSGPAPSALPGYDLVIADVPCSGSGTWARTPWDMSMFGEEELQMHADRQRRIAVALSGHVKKGGYLLYITCSVYRQENEEVVAHLTGNSRLRVVRQGMLEGHESHADSMFAALLTSPA